MGASAVTFMTSLIPLGPFLLAGCLPLWVGALLAGVLGLPVVWDFRSNDVELGGQGAPLAPFFHFACAQFVEADHPLAFLNLGGVGNLTWVDPACADPADPGALLAFDTGPANAPINDAMRALEVNRYSENLRFTAGVVIAISTSPPCS